jgi:predicted outer membrane repeat protein
MRSRQQGIGFAKLAKIKHPEDCVGVDLARSCPVAQLDWIDPPFLALNLAGVGNWASKSSGERPLRQAGIDPPLAQRTAKCFVFAALLRLDRHDRRTLVCPDARTEFGCALEDNMKSAFVAWILFSIGFVVAASPAAIRRVDPNSPGNGPGDAIDWSNAYNNLTDALAAANSGDVLWVADGVYKPLNQGSSHELRAGVRVLGGFQGNPIDETGVNQRNDNPATNGCVLSGDINGDDGPNFTNYSDNCLHVVAADGDNGAELDAFTIRGGNADGTALNGGGGGIFIHRSSLSILRCRVIENSAKHEGGGISAAAMTWTWARTKCRVQAAVSAT